MLTQRRVLGGMAALLLAGSFLPDPVGHVLWSRFRHLKDIAITPITDPLHSLALALRGGRDTELTLEVADNRVEELRRIRQLETELAEARETIAQYERLARMAQAGTVHMEAVDLMSARVTSWSGRSGSVVLTINRGAGDGVVKDLVVTDGVNLVGRVVDAGTMTASVGLISSEGTMLEARIVPPTAEPKRELVGLLRYDPKEDGGQGAFWLSTEHQRQVEVGDLAHLSGGAWPQEAWGLVIGQVIKITGDDDPLNFKRVVVKPRVNLEYLSRVVVLVPVEAQRSSR
ncbi:MAG: hypothetical protein IT443_03775 [Phycisphaeraceae bacterium]|nr:hypothetical protein [Phycisphaeraceae bacterium]